MNKNKYIMIFAILAAAIALCVIVAHIAQIGLLGEQPITQNNKPIDTQQTVALGNPASSLPLSAIPMLPDYNPADEPGIQHSVLTTEQEALRVTLHLPETDNESTNARIQSALQQQADAFLAQNSAGFFEARYTIYRYNLYLVSFAFDLYAYAPDKGLSHTQMAITADLMGDRAVHLSDMFAPGFDYAAIAAEAVETLAEPLAVGYDSFVFDAEAITFFFQSPDGEPLSASVPLVDFGENWYAEQYIMQYFGARADDQIAPEDSPLPEHPTTSPGTAIPPDEQGKYLALTFDDGPTRSCTTRLLDGLQELGVQATFFVLGHRLSQTEDLIARMIDEGHSVGSHTYSHADLTAVSADTIAYQLDATNEHLRSITGQETTLLRPPYGARNAQVAEMATARGMSLIIWSIDPQDWKTRNAKLLSDHIIARAKDGDIILLHDLYETSVDAALIAAEALIAQGFTFVTVDELLEINNGRIVGGIYRTGFGTVEE